MTRAVLVMNERAGTLASRPDLPAQIIAALRAAGFDLTIIGEDVVSGMSARLDAAIASDAPVVIVGGGDGTIRGIASRLANTGRVLGILPLGTLNLLARDLRIPLDPLEAALALGRATPRAMDVAEVNGVVFLCQSVIGVPNAIGRHRERYRGEKTWRALLRLVFAAVRALLRHRPHRLAINAPGWQRPWRIWTRALSVVNNGYEEGAGLMFHRPRLDSGQLYLYVSRNFSIGWSAKMLAAMALGIWKRSREIEILSGAAFTIHSRRRRLRVMNDGEASILRTPLQYSLRPRALMVLAPAA
jgi:diacylglycerol kinase family enzyme